jgi:hypothetical protein
MKVLKIGLFMVLGLVAFVPITKAQQTRKEKRADKEAQMKTVLDSRNFTFTAQQANPMRGGSINLTSDYDFKVVSDSLIAYLPYFGRAYVAPMDPTDGGIRFTSTKFSYVSNFKKSGFEILMKPTDTKDVRQMVLNVSLDGYATLSVISQNRDPITFYGMVEENKKPKVQQAGL